MLPENIVDEPGAPVEALELDRPALGTKPKADDVDAGPTPEAESVDELSRDSADQIGTLSNSLAGVRVAEPLAGAQAPDAIPTELTPTDTRRRHREPVDDAPPPPSPLERSESRRGWLLATLGAVALGGVAIFAVQEPEQPATRGAPAAAATAPAKANTKPAADAGGGAAPKVEPPKAVTPTPPVEPTPPEPEAPAPVEDDTAQPGDSEPTPPEADPQPAVAEPPKPRPSPPPAPTRMLPSLPILFMMCINVSITVFY